MYKVLMCTDTEKLRQQLLLNGKAATVGVWCPVHSSIAPSAIKPDAIGIRDLRLATIGGVLLLLEQKIPPSSDYRIRQDLFWELALIVDSKGPNAILEWATNLRAHSSNINDVITNVVDAMWSWLAAEADITTSATQSATQEVTDVTNTIHRCRCELWKIFQADPESFANGVNFRNNLFTINVNSFRGIIDKKVIVRKCQKRSTDLFTSPTGEVLNRMVSYAIDSKKITVSINKPEFGVDIVHMCQEMWELEDPPGPGPCLIISPGVFTFNDALKVARKLASL